MNVTQHFEAAIKHHNESERHLKEINFKLREKLGDDFTLMFQPSDGWVVLFEHDGFCSNSPISPTQIAELLSMKRAAAVAYLKTKIGLV